MSFLRTPITVAGFLLVIALAAACSVDTAEFGASDEVSSPSGEPAAGRDDEGAAVPADEGSPASGGDSEEMPDALAYRDEPGRSSDADAATRASDADGSGPDDAELDETATEETEGVDSPRVEIDESSSGLQESATLLPKGSDDGDSSRLLSAVSDLTESEKVSRGALLVEAFGLAGGRLTSDSVRACAHDAFVAASEPLRIDQIVAGMETTDADVPVVVAALDECGGLDELALVLTTELRDGLGDLFAPSIAECISSFYADADALAELVLATDSGGEDVGISALARCVGLGDVLAADQPLVGTNERVCLNERGKRVIEALVTVEVREEVVSLDPELITDALAECLPDENVEALSD